jgi:hypothetical protein
MLSGPMVNQAHNAKLIGDSIKKWKVTPFVLTVTGKPRDKWGAYYTILIGKEDPSENDSIRVMSGVIQLLETSLPSPIKKTLSETELKKFLKKPAEKAKPKAKEDDSGQGLFPE